MLPNVLRGEMGFIEPCPYSPERVEMASAYNAYYRERHRGKPGLCGWAQVNHLYLASVDAVRAKLSYDLHSVKNRSLQLDALILVMTIRALLFEQEAPIGALAP